MTDFKLLAEIFTTHQTFVLTTHVNPDADALGSELALQRILKRKNKSVRIINFSSTPAYLNFLDPQNVIEHFNEEEHSEVIKAADVIVALDFNRSDRIVRMSKLFLESSAVKICIDHHQFPENVFSHIFGSPEYCATGHIIHDFIAKTNYGKIDYEIAEPLYAAIMTDTGSFRFDRTTSDVHRIAAELLDAGVVPIELHSKIFDQNSPGKMLLLGDTLKGIEYYGDNSELGVMTVTLRALKKYNTKEDDTDQFINMMMMCETVQFGLKFLELKDGFKVSLRSKGKLPAHLFAAKYGGGGHMNASGIRIKGKKIKELKPIIISEALKFLEESK